jgi:hypothetical protein
MTRTFFSIAALAGASLLTLTQTTHADPKTLPNDPTPKVAGAKTNIVPNSLPPRNVRGTFRARNFNGWRSYCWYPPANCYLFYEPTARQWFFWNDQLAQFLPFRLIRTNPPTSTGVALLPPGAVNNLAPNLAGGVGNQGQGNQRNGGGAQNNQSNQGGGNANQGNGGGNGGNGNGGGNRQGRNRNNPPDTNNDPPPPPSE